MILRHRFSVALMLLLGSLVFPLAGVRGQLLAGEVQLKNGLTLDGQPAWIRGLTLSTIRQNEGNVNSYPVLLIQTDLQRIFVPRRQVDKLSLAADLSRYETFNLKQLKAGRKPMLASLGSYTDVTPFNEHGQRTVTVRTKLGEKPLIQGITRLTPKYLTVAGLTHEWVHGLATTSVPAPELAAILRTATDRQNPDDRMAIARFYLQAGMYQESSAELKSIVADFPELKAKVEEVDSQLRELEARRILSELRRRRAAGQHRLAFAATNGFPVERLSASVLREVRGLMADYEQARTEIEAAGTLLGGLQAELDDPAKAAAVMPLRSILGEELDVESRNRLDAFLKSADDESYSPAEKLALAYSGWVVGSAHAAPDFDTAVRLWDARFLVLEYLRTENSLRRKNLLEQIRTTEGIGPEQIRRMIPLLPPLIDATDVRPGQPQTVEVADAAAGAPASYRVVLPPEYSPTHLYPMIVVLRPAERSLDDALTWWAGDEQKPGQAQRHGYIVIAPDYAGPDLRNYDYNVQAHDVVLRSIFDARKRFSVDSDRVFLTGHGMGGDAAFDVGMSHPHIFAGVIPITGLSGGYCTWYWANCPQLPWYIVGGELDRDSLVRNARVVERMMRHGYNVLYAEYISRGYESYYAEIHRLFEWMALHRRWKFPAEFTAKVLRPTDDRFYWVQAEGFPRNVTGSRVLSGERRARVAPMTLAAKVTAGNSIYVTSGAAKTTIWLSPEFVDFDERITVKMRGTALPKFNDYLPADIETMLEDLRIRGDRQQLYAAKIVIE